MESKIIGNDQELTPIKSHIKLQNQNEKKYTHTKGKETHTQTDKCSRKTGTVVNALSRQVVIQLP